MTTTPLTTWSSAEQHCWNVVTAATEMQRTISLLDKITVGAVHPIVSSTAPTLLITPVHASDKPHLQQLTREITSALSTDALWRTIVTGEYWTLRLTHRGIIIDVSTFLPVATPTQLEIEP